MRGKACCSPSGDHESPAPPVAERGFAPISTGSTKEMRLIPGGEFLMGCEEADGWPDDGEAPIRPVSVQEFYMDATCVTNEQFSTFVEKTRYVTEAERFGWSIVFHLLLSPSTKRQVTQFVSGAEWWCKVARADWRHPEGPDSGLKKRWLHPVVHVSWNDAVAYCHWVGKRLPTEAEWERAARGGLVQKRFPWGNELTPGAQHMCNIWQGIFPHKNTAEDGYLGTAPAKSFKSNGYGLFNMAGNVWEWCHDRFSPNYHLRGPRLDPTGPPTGDRRVIRGGSYLCHESYCNRYRVGARSSNTPDSSAGHMGFRCVRDQTCSPAGAIEE